MEKRMTRMAAVVATVLISLCLFGCQTTAAQRRAAQSDADLQARVEGGSSTVQRFNLKDWSAPNDHTVILVTNDGTRYRAETLGPCMGLDFAHGIAFANRGGFNQIDRFSSVVLTDGTRCPFQSFDKLKAPESKALDAYEKADEKPAQQAASGRSSDDPKPK
jgi:hypothetical protein